ncbi:hypothetical protein N799_01980 [Lysobacter arseniciresistens ZS79]|uniref:Uncharacterized protein n=2 Tax=Novilysobacter TaxID=3382699 RepID=A0A0A0F2C4_9GAMM|nr:hypothetical protein N799_01980 [Lysobacter arseniciresistens ZS79]
MLMLGGALGIAIGIWLAAQALSQSWLYIFMVVPFIGLFVWSLYTGIRLWRGDSYGRKWAPILFASQIPIIATPGATVHWFTGAQFGPALKLAGQAVEATLSANVGANGQFFLASGGDQTILGINLFAAIALFCLVRSNKSFKPKPLRGSA